MADIPHEMAAAPISRGILSLMPEAPQPIQDICLYCHQPILPTYYFCPNCGNKIKGTPLSTSVQTQLGLYAFSIILPLICFLFVTKWQGLKYLRSQDEKTKSIGYIACFLLAVSTVVTIWYAVVWTQQTIQQSVNDINTEMSI